MTLPLKWVLLVEDDKALATALVAELSNTYGLKVIWASTFSDAMMKLNNQKFACLLLDLRLEKHSGMKLIFHVRNAHVKKHLNAQTPIILMSGYLQGDVVVNAAKYVQGVIAKPFDIPDLIQKIWDVTTGPEKALPLIEVEEELKLDIPTTPAATTPNSAPATPTKPVPSTTSSTGDVELKFNINGSDQPAQPAPAEPQQEKTKFIHDLANSLAVVDLHTIRLLKMLSENQSEKELEVTKKLEAQIKKMITLVREEREKRKSS